jgi:Uma2 family endonuclease
MIGAVKEIKEIRKSRVYTFEEYLRREEKATEKHEFYQGKIIKIPGGTYTHSEVTSNTITALKIAVRPLSKLFRVFDSNLKILIDALDSGVYPDALVICEVPQFWNERLDVIANPLLIVEVLSPSTQAYDRLGKFELYKELPSFQEYVLISTDTPSVETRFREEPDLWRIRTVSDITHSVILRALGVSIPLSDIYENIVFSFKK